MSLSRWIIAGLWLLFVAYWAIAAVGIKRSAARRSWSREIGLRLVVILLIAALLQSRSLRQFLAQTERQVGKVILTTNRCCSYAIPNHDGSKQKGYFLCRAKDGEVTLTFVPYGSA